jgi:hypothetical protein
VWINSPTLAGYNVPLPVYIREFECGTVVLNGDTAAHSISLPSGLSRLAGEQAPLYQYIVDDNSSSFRTTAGAWQVKDYDSGYHGATTPSEEEVRPPNGFYHHWAQGAHQAPAGSSAVFDLHAPVAGLYNVSMWWPAAVPARAAWAQAMLVTISPGSRQLAVNLSAQGGDVFFLVAGDVQLDPTSTLAVACPAGGGDCIADAVLVESAARFNDGSAAPSVTLQAFDAIVLEKTAGAPPTCAHTATTNPRA